MSSQTQTAVPITFGQVFAPGAVPAGQSLSALSEGSVLPLQVDAKANHADGSLRHALLTAVVPTLPGNGARALALTLSAPSGGAPISASALLATSFDSIVTLSIGGTTYRASARELLQADASQLWLSGPLVSEWHLVSPVKTAGGQAHPHLTARFAVRAYQGLDRVRVDVTIENNWAFAAAPQAFTYDVAITVGGAPAYSQNGLRHFSLARWRKVFWWGETPAVEVQPDRGALLLSGALPFYDTTIRIAESDLAALWSEWSQADTAPMGAGLVEPYMPMTGGRRDIGPLPGWAAQYVLSLDRRAKLVTLGIGDLAGSWPIHYRDQNTDRPVSLADYPYMSLLGNPGDLINPNTGQSEAFPDCVGDCATPYAPDSAHQPSLAYLPYLLTGDYYYLEELQFWANLNLLESNPYYRGFEQGLLHWGQTRGQAWSLRALAEAAYITPDGHGLKRYFSDRLEFNRVWYATDFLGANTNALGINTSGYALAYENGRGVGPWQDDFFTWVVGYVVDLGFSTWEPLLDYKARFPVGRMTAAGTCWVSGAPYYLLVRAGNTAPLYTTFAQAYEATIDPAIRAQPCGSAAMGQAFNPPLSAGEMSGYAYSDMGYPSNMQPALAVAVQTGIAGADQAWATFMARAVKPTYSAAPSFAVVPRSSGIVVTPQPWQTERVYLPSVRRYPSTP
ncbi:MAG: hypothetical protein JNL73_18980 [Anaerolineales bacterium]|nr:hypothetical protein [Anaerolineales bacterium]